LVGNPLHDRTSIAIVLENYGESEASDLFLGSKGRDRNVYGIRLGMNGRNMSGSLPGGEDADGDFWLQGDDQGVE